ncbi:hypothetical protein ACOME3_001398 [Neoechinorhynchus agilis]
MDRNLDIQPEVLNDSKIIAEEYDIVTPIKGNDRKTESDSVDVTTKRATVEEQVKDTSERMGKKAIGETNNYKDIRLTSSKSINPSIYFCYAFSTNGHHPSLLGIRPIVSCTPPSRI